MRLCLVTLLAPFALVASTAHADAVGPPPPCPPGATAFFSHQGRWCVPASCDPPCWRPGESCRPYRVCSRPMSMPVWYGRAGQPSGAPDTTTIDQVVDTCPPSGTCDGHRPPPVTTGEPAGEPTCVVMDVCVPTETLPPFPPVTDYTPPPVPPAPVSATAPVPVPAPATESSCSSCAVAHARTSWLTLLAPLAILLSRRRVRSRRALSALALLFLFSRAHAGAQRPLEAGPEWSIQAIQAGERGVEVACAPDRAYWLDFDGTIRVWHDDAVSVLPPYPPLRAQWHMAASPDGAVYVTVIGGIARYDGSWTTLPLRDPNGAPLSREVTSLIAFDAQHVYAVAEGAIFRIEGDAFVGYSPGTWRGLHQIVGRSPIDLWISADSGVVVHWDGRSFTEELALDDPYYVNLDVAADGSVWAMTHDHAARRVGGTWQPADLPEGTTRLVETSIGDFAVGQYATSSRIGGTWHDELRWTNTTGACALPGELVVIDLPFGGPARVMTRRL